MAILISCPNCSLMGDIGGLGFYEGLRFHCPHCDCRYEVRWLRQKGNNMLEELFSNWLESVFTILMSCKKEEIARRAFIAGYKAASIHGNSETPEWAKSWGN